MQDSFLTKAMTVMLQLFTFSAWTTLLMEVFGATLLKWQFSHSWLFSISNGFQYAGERVWAWTGLVNFVFFLFAFIAAGALASMMTFMACHLAKVCFVSVVNDVVSPFLKRHFTRQ
jgi:hypothetical protein